MTERMTLAALCIRPDHNFASFGEGDECGVHQVLGGPKNTKNQYVTKIVAPEHLDLTLIIDFAQFSTGIQGVLRASHIDQYFLLPHIFGFHIFLASTLNIDKRDKNM